MNINTNWSLPITDAEPRQIADEGKHDPYDLDVNLVTQANVYGRQRTVTAPGCVVTDNSCQGTQCNCAVTDNSCQGTACRC